jgi:FHS family L-fucose permease-like MFS transporter
LAAPAQLAGTLVSVYWGLAMVGRFMGAGIMRKANPALVLHAIARCGAFAMSDEHRVCRKAWSRAVTVLSVGLFNSIMFPTIFALAVEGMGERTPQASGIICLAIVGGAIVPLITGAVADHIGLNLALLVPALLLHLDRFYGLFAARNKLPHDALLLAEAPVIVA